MLGTSIPKHRLQPPANAANGGPTPTAEYKQQPVTSGHALQERISSDEYQKYIILNQTGQKNFAYMTLPTWKY